MSQVYMSVETESEFHTIVRSASELRADRSGMTMSERPSATRQNCIVLPVSAIIASSYKLQASIASGCSLELSAVLYFASYFYVQKQAFVFHPYTSSLKMM